MRPDFQDLSANAGIMQYVPVSMAGSNMQPYVYLLRFIDL